MDEDMIDENKSIQEVEKVLSSYSLFSIPTGEFDKCVDHVIHLIKDAALLYKNGSYSTAVFLSVTIIEEVAKINIGLFTRLDPEGNLKKGKDKLHNHKAKHAIGSNFTISMGERLQKAIGQEEMEKIINLAYSGGLIDYREGALYCDRANDHIQVPSDVIDEKTSRNLLLFAIESFDDNLVGWDHYSIQRSYETDKLFCEIAGIEYEEPSYIRKKKEGFSPLEKSSVS